MLGHPTLSREVAALLSDPDVEVFAVRGPGEPLNLNDATVPLDARGGGPRGRRPRVAGGLAARRRARHPSISRRPLPTPTGSSSAVPGERLGAIAAELGAIRAPLDRAGLVDAVWRATWPHDRLVFGSSRLVRVADAVLGGKKVPVHANRGLAGIDGTVATAHRHRAREPGRRATGGHPRRCSATSRSCTMSARCCSPPAEREPRLQVIVGNDGGGTIFDGLEVAGVAGRDAMDRVLYTPHTVRLEQLALAYGWEYRRVTTRSALDQALDLAGRRSAAHRGSAAALIRTRGQAGA